MTNNVDAEQAIRIINDFMNHGNQIYADPLITQIMYHIMADFICISHKELVVLAEENNSRSVVQIFVTELKVLHDITKKVEKSIQHIESQK